MCKKLSTRELILMGIMVALNIVFVRFLSFDTGIVRISFGFLPISVSGMLLGPVWGGVVGVVADFLGMLINGKGGTYFPLFAISEFLYGFGYGLLFKKRCNLSRVIGCVLILTLVVNLILSSCWLYLYYILVVGTERGFLLILSSRFWAALVNMPIQVIGLSLICRYVEPQMKLQGWRK